ncbi:hypothetical protein M422DRAFT_268773 [Sphaerobolus stellatus SS14]|uniref:Fungal lipase-type domain-containing protein n=1 Tax=Sphaerobolus stellatus (strain SS14) TaxID=990650 RepID=A0A0C9UX25_SPHS4|nr:hypothetical protein M422DRAFT_268773 [Sphaerobolus stellatus SS14]
MSVLSILGLAFLTIVSGLVVPRDSTVIALTSAAINAFTPYTYYAAAAYCTPAVVNSWSCGAKCNANSRFVPTASGGNGGTIQYWYMGYDPSLNAFVVAHQGTDTSKIVADFTDVDFVLTSLGSTNFPGITNLAIKSTRVSWATQKTLSAHSGASVTLVGHSLGAALALVDALCLPLHLPTGTKFKFIGYGMPRVGNTEFTAYLDAHFSDLIHINNKEDVVPILPGVHHPHGEVHIADDNVWHACAGEDNTSSLCTVGDVTSIFDGDTTSRNLAKSR